MTIDWPGVQDTTLNGPLPSGFLLNSLFARSSFWRTWRGTMPRDPAWARNIGSGRLRFILTVRASGVSTLATWSSPSVDDWVSGLRAVSTVNLTSSAVTGWPSHHLA